MNINTVIPHNYFVEWKRKNPFPLFVALLIFICGSVAFGQETGSDVNTDKIYLEEMEFYEKKMKRYEKRKAKYKVKMLEYGRKKYQYDGFMKQERSKYQTKVKRFKLEYEEELAQSKTDLSRQKIWPYVFIGGVVLGFFAYNEYNEAKESRVAMLDADKNMINAPTQRESHTYDKEAMEHREQIEHHNRNSKAFVLLSLGTFGVAYWFYGDGRIINPDAVTPKNPGHPPEHRAPIRPVKPEPPEPPKGNKAKVSSFFYPVLNQNSFGLTYSLRWK